MNINSLTTLAYIKASMAMDNIKAIIKGEADSFSNDERGVEGFVVALILVGIAAIVAVFFKDQLIGPNGLITQLINKIIKQLELDK